MAKKEAGREMRDNSFGVVGVTLGILSLAFALFQPILGIVIGAIGLMFGLKQNKTAKNKWSKTGKILNIVGIILGVIAIIATFSLIKIINGNPELLGQLQNAGY